MAAALCLRALFLLQLLLLCSGQYYYNYYYYDNSWCPFGVNGMCTCENDIVDCTGQGLSAVPLDLPTTTKQLILKNNKITTVDFMPLASYSSLEFLDLSSNSISTLPYGILEYLSALTSINLSDNPWQCDCNLNWLSVWLLTTAASSNIQMLDSASTHCVSWPSIPMLDLIPADFSPCAEAVRSPRSVSSAIPQPIQTFTKWTSVCFYWFNQTICDQGPSEAGSCVLSPDTLDVALVEFTTFTTHTDAVACRNYCFASNHTYHAFENSTFHCLCGDEMSSNACPDCNSASIPSTSVTLCWLMQVPNTSHVLSDVAISFTSPVVTHSVVSFTVSGVPSLINSLSWAFGDGVRRDNTTVTTVNHTYVYAGSFSVSLELCSAPLCRTVKVRVRVDSQNVLTSLTCPTLSESSERIALNVSVANTYSSLVNWTRTSSAGTLPVSGCTKGWTAFRERCIKLVARNKTLTRAEASCNQKGGTLLTLHYLEEIQELLSLLSSSLSTAWIGAQHNGTVYYWDATLEAAYLLRALSIDRTAGDCLVMSSTGLQAADCSSQHEFLCQQDPVPCPEGQQLGSSGFCYYLETTVQSWQDARSQCQGLYGGDLAILTDKTTTSQVISALGITSASWIGLTALDLLGHYTWVNGESVTWSNWASNNWRTGVRWPCVTVSSTGSWEVGACDQTLPFVCQYSLAESVTPDLHIAGSADLRTNVTFQNITSTQSVPQNAGQTLVMPGLWFAKEGQLIEVNFRVDPQSSDNVVGVLVLRPSCPTGKVVIPPGCSQNVFAQCGKSTTSCPSLPVCSSEQEHPCPLTHSCIYSSTPCSCASSSTSTSTTNVDCSATDPDNDLHYTLVGQAAFEIPAAGGSLRAEISERIDVQTHDILAFQSRESDFGFCQVDPLSEWQQVAFIRVGDKWTDTSRQLSLSSYTKQENYVCLVSALYGSAQTVSLPDTLAYVPESSAYTFDAVVEHASHTDSCTLETVEELGDLVWIYPTVTTTSGGFVVYVEAEIPQYLVAMVPKGSVQQVGWELSTGVFRKGSGVSTCPASIVASSAECQEPTSELADPFLVFDDTFSLFTSLSLTLNVSNPLGWKSVTVVVNAEERIQNLALYHTSCAVLQQCAPLVEVGVAQHFVTNISAGSVSVYEFSKNSTVVQSNQTSSLWYHFASPGLYIISVNASNGLNWMESSLQVSAKVRAQVTGLTLEPVSPMFVSTGVSLTITLKATVAQWAEVMVTWDYGDGQSVNNTEYATSNSLDLHKIHTYSVPGTYTLQVTLQDAFGVEVNITSAVNVLSDIEQVSTSVNPKIIATGNSTAIGISVQSLTSNNPNFGDITYTIDFQDGSAIKTHTSTRTSKTYRHVYRVNGAYKVSISVQNQFSSLSTTTDVIVQQCPSQVVLSYDGPKNVSEQLTFTAQVTQGSDLQYAFDFGDGSAVVRQTTDKAVYKYNGSGTYNATVIVSNTVCSVFSSESVVVMDSNTLVVGKINHSLYAAVNEVVLFTVDVVTLDIQKVSLDWNVQVSPNSQPMRLTLRGTKQFNFQFQLVGNFTLWVNVKLDNGPQRNSSSTIIIQDKVSSVNMTAPSLVSYTTNQPALVTCTAISPDGTNVDFRWSNNGTVLASLGPNITLHVSTAGMANISVVAFNEVSEAETYNLVDVQRIVDNVTISCQTCISGKFIAANTVAQFLSLYEGTSTTVEWTIGATTGTGDVFSHTFSSAGTQSVDVVVFNLVNSDSSMIEVVVEDEVSVVTLVADNPVTSEGSTVQLIASHTRGTDVTYTWQCGTQHPYLTSANTTHVVLNTWGLHTCNVTVANNVSSQQATIDLQVLQTISSLGIKNLTAGSTLYVAINKAPSVEADCNTYFGVNFTWIVMKAGAVIGRVDGPILTHSFPTVDTYDLELKAINAISNSSVTVLVEALEPITNLAVKANDTTVVVGESILLTAGVATGTSPTLAWFVDGMPLSSVSGHSFPYSFSSTGSYVIEVDASNALSSERVNITILVQDPVQNVTINSSLNLTHPYVSRYAQLTFQGSVSKGSDPEFHWTVLSPSSSQTYKSQTLQQTFNETGLYTFELFVANAVSQENQTLVVYVEKAITSLNMTISPGTITATNSVVSLVAKPNADAVPVTYNWQVDGQLYSVASINQSFSKPGLYSVQLVVYNNISSMADTATIEVQEPVTLLQMADCNVTRQAGVSSTLSATAQGTNISFSWIVQYPTQNQTSLGPTLTLTFSAGGSYPVHVLAGNKVHQETLTCVVLVQDAIENVALSIDDPPINYIFTNQNVTFTVTGDYLANASYTWNFMGVYSVKTLTPYYIGSFPLAQHVVLVMTVANDVSQVQVSVNFTVQDLQCNLPVVTHVGASSRTVSRSKTSRFDVYIDNKGCTLYTVTHTWNIFDTPDCTQLLHARSVSLPSVEQDKPTLILPVGLLPATTQNYCVRYTLGYENTPVAEEVLYNLTTVSSPLVAVISGGGWREVDGSSTVCLDGSLSWNPDSPQSGSAGMMFAWMCQTVSGAGSCFQPVTNSSSSLCVSSLTVGTYNITLTVLLTASSHTPHSTSQLLKVSVTTPPVLSVGVDCTSCQGTGDYRVSSSQHLALSAHCQGCGTDIDYTWTVTRDGGIAVTLGTGDTSTGVTSANLVILRNTALSDGSSYTFTVTADTADGSRTQGTAYITLPPNLPPNGGVCTATPDSILVLQEVVTVTCSGWLDVDDTESQLLYEIKVEEGSESYVVYYGSRSTQDVFIASTTTSSSTTVQLIVSVIDEWGARTVALTKSVTLTAPGVTSGSLSQDLYLSANSTLTMLMQQGDPVPLLQYSLALTFMLNSASSTTSLSTADLMTQAMVRAAIAVCVSNSVPVSTFQQVQQTAYLLQQLTAYPDEFQTSGGHTLVLQGLQQISTVLQNGVQPGLDRDDFAFPSFFSIAYNVMQAVASSSSSSSSVTSLAGTFPQFVGLSTGWGSISQSLDFSTSTLSQSHKQEVVTESFRLGEEVTGVVLQAVILGEDELTYQVGGMQVEGVRSTVGSLTADYMVQGSSRFLLPGSAFSGLSASDEILKIMITYDSNPFTWGYIDQHTITTRVPTLSFKYTDGTDLPITDLPSTIEILMFDSDGNDYSNINGDLVNSTYYDPLAHTQFDTWTLEGGLSKKLLIDSQMGTTGVSGLHVMVRVEALPNATDLQTGAVPTAAIKAYFGVGYEASATQYDDHKEITTAHMASGVDHRLYTFFVSSQDFSDSTEYSVTLVNDDADHDVNISSTVYLSSCQFYDETSQVWSAAGCSVSEESIVMATDCDCNHLTAFGGSSLVPISSIRFSDLAALELGLNPVTLVAVCTILLLYIVGAIVCRHLDRADLRRISLVPLCGRDGMFKYHITIVTGRHIGAGTSAHVGIKLYGEHGKSEARHLTKTSAFQRNSGDTFLIATDNDLGTLHKVRVWHDNTGSTPSWYLTQVQVQDFQSGQRYVFPADTWLSLELEEGMLQTELCAADQEELHSFSRVFHTSLANSFAERHMWVSIFNRPDHSRFTRVQRVTCCVTLIYLYMFLNAMWYGLIKDQSDAADAISWAVIGWEEMLIAVVSVACIFPVAVILICIFKRSRSKADVFSQAMRPQSAQTLEIDAMCDVSQYGESLRTMTPNEDWSTIFERESTTESIPNSPRILPSPRTPRTPRTARSQCAPHNSSNSGESDEVRVQRTPRTPRSSSSPGNSANSGDSEETHTPRTPRTPRHSSSPSNSPKSGDSEEPISSQLRRTTAVNRNAAHSSFPGSSKKSTVQVIRRTQELMWNQENILKSWPEKLPSFAEEEKEKEKPTDESTAGEASTSKDGPEGTATSADCGPSTSSGKTTSGGSGTAAAKISKSMSMTSKTSPASSLKKTNSVSMSRPAGQFTKGKVAPQQPKQAVTTRKTASFKTETENDSDDHEEFIKRLDQIDRELKKSASIRSKASLKGGIPKGLVKKHSSHSSQSAISDLFESDDEWASEGLADRGGRRGDGATVNHRQDHNSDRRASVTSLMRLRMASMHVPSSAGSSFLRRDSTFMRRDSTFNSFMMSEKSRTTLSALLKNRMQLLGKPTEDGGWRLPWFCVNVGYAICVGLSLLSILMVLLYGYNFGPAVALRWLLSVLLAFLLSMLVLEPVKVVILALYVAAVVKDAEKDVEADSIDVMPSIEANEQLKEVKFRPLGGFALLQAHKEGRKKIRLRTMIRQTITYLLLTAAALAVANVYFGPDFYRATDHIENSFVFTNSTSSASVDFYNISSTDVFWEWARDVWTPALYRHDLVSSEENPVLLGPARLRLIRSTMVDCMTNETREVRQCVGRLEFTEDTDTYSPGWLPAGSSNASWVHSSADQLQTWAKFGQDILYSGSGYVQQVGTSYNQTLDILQQLDDDKWLDRRSRALFMEWTSYSAGEDLFSAITLLLEFPITGGVLASYNIQTQRLYVFNSDRVDPLYVCQVLMLLPALYLLIQTIITVCEQKCQFVRIPGNWLQMVTALLCVASVAMYVTCVVSATDTLARFSGGSGSFTNFEGVVHLHDVLRVLHACLLFLLLVKIACQVRFIRPLSVFPRTLSTAFTRLCGATFIFLLLLLSYTHLAYLFYGSELHDYRTFHNSLVSMFGVMRGSINLTPALEQHRIFSHFFFYSFYAFVYGLFVALVIAVLQDAYKLTRSQMFFKSSLEPQDYEMIDFMLKRFKLWAGIIKPKPAFRRVQFEGQPSLPSRGSTPATSSRRSPSQNSMERNTPTPDLIASTGNGDALDRLLPAWERLLTLLGTNLEKDEQRQVGHVQTAVSHWCGDQERKSGPTGPKPKNTSGKPPVNPKSKFSLFRQNFQNSSNEPGVAQSGQRQAMTPPASSSRHGEGAMNSSILSAPSAPAIALPERPSSESEKLRSVPAKIAQPADAGVKDTFPGSTSQRNRPSSEDGMSRPVVSAGPSVGHKVAAPSTSGTGAAKKGPGITVRQPATLSLDKSDPQDNTKQAWDG